MHRLTNAIIGLGVVLVGVGIWQLGVLPGSRVAVPTPVALERAAAQRAASISTPTPATLVPTLAPVPAAVPTALPAPAGKIAAAPLPPAPDALDRHLAAQAPPPGYAVRLAIPAIKLDTDVTQAGIVADANGALSWQTLPFVAVHYGDLTSLIGAPGNAVIAGHVVTLREGNVFQFLYQLDLDDRIQVWDNHQLEHDFHVVDIKLVPPSDLSVMDPTPDETLTLITCGGTFDPIAREFSDRLIVTAKPL